ncbi:hypothetical protein KUTeg_024913 [Tegillarca granosa]|uniref:MD-2-related lipid-recognition domain-containing protein n=1 Tax=Tegillarca granosa TaxID=220873 RepID=A0ABQ9E3D8_TEGGR|nr:hypothetical protein KUTeg_024913 [Tegillarca granosa]
MIGECPDAVTKAGLQCQCPFKTGNFNVQGASFEIDYSSTLLTGDYMVRGNVSSSGVLAACIEVNFTVVQSDNFVPNRWSKPFKILSKRYLMIRI